MRFRSFTRAVLAVTVSLTAAACSSTSSSQPSSPTSVVQPPSSSSPVDSLVPSSTAPPSSSSSTSSPPSSTVAPDVAVLPAIEGLEVLYMGHSFGRPFADLLTEAAESAGVVDHVQHMVFRGGEKGAPQAMWADPKVRAKIVEVLDSGNVDVVIMMCCSEDLLASELTFSKAELEIARYALEQNPDTRFGLGLPWVDFPADYVDADAHRARSDAGYPAFDAFATQLGIDLGGIDVFSFYHGAAIYELRDLFEQGLLPDVVSLTGRRADSVFTDQKGHVGNIAKDAGVLIWLNAIYGIDPLSVPFNDSYQTDVRVVASDAISNSAGLLVADPARSVFSSSVERVLSESSKLLPEMEGFLRGLDSGPYSVDAFEVLVSAAGLSYRPVQIDGVLQITTKDFRVDRVNVVIEDAMVVSVSSVG